MKNLIKLSFLVAILGFGMTSCKQASQGADALKGAAKGATELAEGAAKGAAGAVEGVAGAAANAVEGAAGAVGSAVSGASDAAKALLASADKTYNVTKGSLQWTGTKVGGEHMGAIKVSEGVVGLKGGKIVGGGATIDMKSITVTDIKDAEKNANLVGHLSNGDFFEVEKFPTATFNVTNVAGEGKDTKITGDLTIKGITKSVTIPANVIVAGDKLSIVSTPFKINRTEWGINYSSGVIGTAKDKLIYDEIGLVLSLEAAAKAAAPAAH